MTNDVSHQFQFTRQGTKVHRLALIDGPNMDNLGHRSKKVYGPHQPTLEALHEYVQTYGKNLGVDVETFVSDYEGAILEFIHQSAERVDGDLINPAGLTSSDFATPHALIESHRPFIEMHFSNPEANPDAARGAPVGPLKSWFSPYATGKMTGLRQYGYIGALVALTLSLDDMDVLGADEGEQV
jgi:3-dehydroquinate dehydratase II